MTPRDAAHAAADRELLSRVPDDWEGDLATAHPNRCLLRDRLLYADILNDDGSHRATWRCHKRAGHEGPCSSHNDCGVMNGGVVCGNLPGHRGPHAWQTSIVLDAYAERDLYVRAFLAGAQWQHTQESPFEKFTYDEDARVAPLTNSPSPSTGSTASPDNAKSEQRGKA